MSEPRQGEDGTGAGACARVTRLSTTPVKGLALHHPDAILLLRTGAAGDREFFVIDGRDRLISIWKTGRLVRFRAAHDARSRHITLSSAEEVVCDGPAQLGAPVIADFYSERKVAGTVMEGPWNAVLSDAAGGWQDAVYLSLDQVIDASDLLLSTVPHAGGLAVNGTYPASGNAVHCIHSLPRGRQAKRSLMRAARRSRIVR